MSTGSMSAKRSGTRLPLYFKLAAGLFVLAVVAVAAYLVLEPVRDLLTSVRVEILSALGLGVVPVGAWLAAFAAIALLKREWLHPKWWRLWIASAALVALIVGIMAFFEPVHGLLGRFTLGGDVSLGGGAGNTIIGRTSFTGVLRLIGIIVLGLVILSPLVARDISLAVVLAAGVVIGGIAQRLSTRKPRRRERASRATTAFGSGISTLPVESYSTSGTVTALPETDASPADDEPLPFLVVTGESAGDDPPEEEMDEPDEADAETDDVEPIMEEVAIPAEEEVLEEDKAAALDEPANGVAGTVTAAKFNRFWNEPRQAPVLDQSGEESEAAEQHVVESEKAVDAEEVDTDPAPVEELEVKAWAKPPLDLLEDAPESAISEQDIRETAETIVRTLTDYGVEVEIGHIRPGPTVTMYGLTPGWVRRTKQVKEKDEEGNQVVREEETNRTRVKVDSILSREKDLALALKTPSIRIETPAMGTSQVGIEVPNPNPSMVAERMVMESADFKRLRAKAALPVALGKGSGGETEVIDLTKMPHLLIAGSTGSGKSVCLNAIISCLIMEKSPEEMRLLLIDPKRVELTPYNGIPHLLTPVVVETDKVVGLLKGLIQEMMDRYRKFESAGARNIEIYNQKVPERMPYIVVAVDELADLMMTAAFDVEQSLCRLAQMGRATGIHLVVATQRPSVDVVTGLIKANFPSRVAFAVSSQIDSRTILDTAGADKLLGRGDMLYLPVDASTPRRIQNVFISDREIERLVTFWQSTPRGPRMPLHLRVVKEENGHEAADEDSGGGKPEEDLLMDKAIELGRSYSKLSTSLLQRRLRIGYPRAARLKDELEDRGIIGPGGDVIISQDPSDGQTP